jgi:hypothetical protein
MKSPEKNGSETISFGENIKQYVEMVLGMAVTDGLSE